MQMRVKQKQERVGIQDSSRPAKARSRPAGASPCLDHATAELTRYASERRFYSCWLAVLGFLCACAHPDRPLADGLNIACRKWFSSQPVSTFLRFTEWARLRRGCGPPPRSPDPMRISLS